MSSINKSKLKNYNISLKNYSYIIELIHYIDKILYNKYFNFNNYSVLCKKLLNISENKNIYQNRKFNIIKKEEIKLDVFRYFFINKIKENIKETDQNLIITNTTPIVKEFNEIKVKLDCQFFENEETSLDKYLDAINNLANLKISEGITNKSTIQYLNETKITKKYDNIICKIGEFSMGYYINVFTPTKLPNILFVITQSLKQLEEGGNLYLFLRLTLVNETVSKIFNLLHNSFKKVKILDNNNQYDTGLYIVCQRFQDNVSPQTITKLTQDCIKSRKYNYKVCQVMEYLYYNSVKNIDKNTLYKFSEADLKEIGKVNLKDIKQKSLKFLDDISINPKSNSSSKFFLRLLEFKYNEFFDNLNYTILKHSRVDEKNNIIVDEDFFNKITYDNMVNLLNYYKKIKKPFNKTYLAYINEYNDSIVDSLYGFRENINFHLVKYTREKISKNKSKKSINKSKKKSIKSKKISNRKKLTILKSNQALSELGNYKEYHYQEFDNMQDASILGYQMKENLLKTTKSKKIDKSVKIVSEGLTRGVSAYVLQKYRLPHKTSNAYMKLWEIYNTFHNLMPNKRRVKVFHLAEAPGQWINCTRHYLETKKNKVEDYDWMANSLNHNHPTNIKKYGKGIFNDQYGLIKKYPDKWLYGADNTGDITKSKNVIWFHKYMSDWEAEDNKRIDLITGDAGMRGNLSLVELQKIEYGQIAMVAACSSIGSNCVIKHFLNLINAYPNSYNGTGYLINYLYLYYLMFEEIRLIKPHTSSPNSREFYVVGLRFHGIEPNNLKKIIKQLDNYQENHCLFKKEEIPEEFYKQVVKFADTIFKINTEQYELQTMLMTCIVNPDPIILKATNCQKYLDPEFIKKIQTKRYKEWIKTYRFE